MNRLWLLQQVLENVPPYVWRDYAGVDPRPQQQQLQQQPQYPQQQPGGPTYP